MRNILSRAVLASVAVTLLSAVCMQAAAQDSFHFDVISHAFSGTLNEDALRRALRESDAGNPAFIVVNGIKSATEPCSDALYSARRDVLTEAQAGVIVSLAAGDWIGCRNKNASIAIERLNRVRDLFFSDEFSFGASRIALLRQSVTPKFRSYTENARWEVGNILFATINLPAANNHFVQDGGRNNEFEDRLIANKNWLQRLFALATQRKMAGIVLFADGNPLTQPGQRPFMLHGQRDGFAETRQRITTLAGKFRGKVLLVHGENPKSASAKGIVWRRNLGSIGVASGQATFMVNSRHTALFTLTKTPPPERTIERPQGKS
jgi:hypothetical protein